MIVSAHDPQAGAPGTSTLPGRAESENMGSSKGEGPRDCTVQWQEHASCWELKPFSHSSAQNQTYSQARLRALQ